MGAGAMLIRDNTRKSKTLNHDERGNQRFVHRSKEVFLTLESTERLMPSAAALRGFREYVLPPFPGGLWSYTIGQAAPSKTCRGHRAGIAFGEDNCCISAPSLKQQT